MNERLRELVSDLRRRAASCTELKKREPELTAKCRLGGKAMAYEHAAEMVEELLRTTPTAPRSTAAKD